MKELNFITQETQTTDAERKNMMRWFAQQPEMAQIQIEKLHRDFMTQRKDKYRPLPSEYRMITWHVCLILAIKARYRVETTKDNRHSSPEAIEKRNELRMQTIKAEKKKSSPKLEKVIAYSQEILKWREGNESWRDIATYIGKYHKIKISHAYIRNVITETYGDPNSEP